MYREYFAFFINILLDLSRSRIISNILWIIRECYEYFINIWIIFAKNLTLSNAGHKLFSVKDPLIFFWEKLITSQNVKWKIQKFNQIEVPWILASRIFVFLHPIGMGLVSKIPQIVRQQSSSHVSNFVLDEIEFPRVKCILLSFGNCANFLLSFFFL